MSNVTVQTSQFGVLEIDEAEIIHFAQGLPGFPDARRFVLLDHVREAPFHWLQSVDDAGLAFMIIDPVLVKPDYTMSLPDHAFADLHAKDGDEFKVVVILTIPPGEPDKITANLQAPLVFNTANRFAKQLILVDQYTTRYPIAGSNSDADVPAEHPMSKTEPAFAPAVAS
jgi:flagellar assembly factor FliW